MLPSSTYNVQSLASLALVLSLAVPVCSKSSQDFDVQAALHYLPSKTVGAIGFAVYLTISSLIFWRLVRNRDWWGLCLPIGAFFEALGFLIRIFISQPKLRSSLSVYIVMDLFIVLSPAAFLAFNYILYGRLIRMCVGREHSYIRPDIVGRTFVISDVITFLVQAAGGSLQVQVNSAQVGRVIFLIGIILQGVSYVIYVSLVALSHRSIRKATLLSGLDPHMETWYKIFKLLYFSSVFIIIRSIYRVIETAQGHNGYLITHEWAFLVLDSIPLAIATSIYIFYWPGKYIPKEGSAKSHAQLPMTPLTS